MSVELHAHTIKRTRCNHALMLLLVQMSALVKRVLPCKRYATFVDAVGTLTDHRRVDLWQFPPNKHEG